MSTNQQRQTTDRRSKSTSKSSAFEKTNQLANIAEILARSGKLEIGTLKRLTEMTENLPKKLSPSEKQTMNALQTSLYSHLRPDFTRQEAFNNAVKKRAKIISQAVPLITGESIESFDDSRHYTFTIKCDNKLVLVQVNKPAPYEPVYIFDRFNYYGHKKNIFYYSLDRNGSPIIQMNGFSRNSSSPTIMKVDKDLQELDKYTLNKSKKETCFITLKPFDAEQFRYQVAEIAIYVLDPSRNVQSKWNPGNYRIPMCIASAVVVQNTVILNKESVVESAAWLRNFPSLLKSIKKNIIDKRKTHKELLSRVIKDYFANRERLKVEKLDPSESWVFLDTTSEQKFARIVDQQGFRKVLTLFEMVRPTSLSNFLELVSDVPIGSPYNTRSSSVKLTPTTTE